MGGQDPIEPYGYMHVTAVIRIGLFDIHVQRYQTRLHN